MILLDMRTLVFSNVVIDIICMLVILLLWHQSRKRFAGMGFWVADFAFQTAAVFLIIMRGSIPDWMSMVLSNTLVIGGAILGYMGLVNFVGKKTSQVHNYVLLAAFACVHAYFTLIQPNLAARTLNLSAGLLIICFQYMWLVYRVEPGMRQLTFGVGMVFGAYCLVSVVRIIGFITGGHPASDYFRSGAFESLILISYQILFILLTYGLVLMVNKRLLLEVRQAEEKSRLLIKYAPSMLYEIDFQRPAFKSVNDAMCQFLGYTREELLAMNPFDLLDDEGKAVFRERIRRKLAGEAISESVEYKSKTKDGREVYGVLNMTFTYKDGKPEGAFVVAHDITERKRMEEELRRSRDELETRVQGRTAELMSVVETLQVEMSERERAELALQEASLYARSLIEASLDPLVTISRDGKIMDVNRATELATGLSRDILIGSDFSDYFAEPEKAREGYKQVFSKGFVRDYPLAVRHTSGKITDVLYNAAVYRNKAGEVQGVFAAARDITERKRAEEALRESENRLRLLSTALLNVQERERMMIAGEIHDSMGASLAAAKFKVEDVLNQMVDDNPQAKVALNNVIPILQGTIEEARRIQMSLRPSMLDDLGILATINWFCRQFESTYSNIQIKREIDIEEHEIPESLKIVIYRVLQEALNNTAKHSKALLVLLSLRKAKQNIELVIRDSGQGFDLREAYSRKGTAKGLGLDSMRERAELSGGSFNIESAEGKGTTIFASWPLGRNA